MPAVDFRHPDRTRSWTPTRPDDTCSRKQGAVIALPAPGRGANPGAAGDLRHQVKGVTRSLTASNGDMFAKTTTVGR
ncbi:uncharacterized protein CMC5_053170 [Chondromyces crocatus]|uniref:Uncharacterized protein n=1 Tax=Chondromyces crocatus TaxID=52 RepID=A0A0K1EJX3_CHOCO|nr:uncharacterized protein CMC5_053170 [Chondromyces crocatus]